MDGRTGGQEKAEMTKSEDSNEVKRSGKEGREEHESSIRRGKKSVRGMENVRMSCNRKSKLAKRSKK